jgi:hypothetical protein
MASRPAVACSSFGAGTWRNWRGGLDIEADTVSLFQIG